MPDIRLIISVQPANSGLRVRRSRLRIAQVPLTGLVLGCLILVLTAETHSAEPFVPTDQTAIIFEDDFSSLEPGQFSSVVGAHTEYHYLPDAAPKGPWSVTSFRSDIGSQRAWKVFRVDQDAVLAQTFDNLKTRHAHPMVVAGDEVWKDYTLKVKWAPQSTRAQSGIVFRYHNDRCYYWFGVRDAELVLKLVRHATEFRKPFEQVLATAPFSFQPSTTLTGQVTVQGSHIRAELNGGPTLEADDDTYEQGQIGLMADVPTNYFRVSVVCTPAEQQRIIRQIDERESEEAALQAANPGLRVWKKIKTEGFGVGRNIRFGDLNSDGQFDVLIGQVQHHGPKDRNSELSCLTAMTLDGEMLWQVGDPDPWKDHLTNDVAFQIHDLDGDGTQEVIYCKDMKIVVADGATGKTKASVSTPEMPSTAKPPYNRFPRILGDALYFCDLRGKGRDEDMILKDRYRHLWALDNKLNILWSAECNTGHYPFAYDVDKDGRDELALGYSLYDDDGNVLWSLDKRVKDHADGVAVVRFGPGEEDEPRVLCAASDSGMFFSDIRGQIIKHHYIGHVQNPAVADFRPDLPGLEAVSINYWGNQGIIHLYDSSGDIYHDLEPCQHGSMCLPVNWTGRRGEFFVLSANVEEGGMFDGWGRRVVRFPNDGHPDMCNAVLDITGDCRDEVVVWDPNELWVYTQSGEADSEPLYNPVRNPLYNYSNYQTTVSLPR
jgi:rhamnogalacturonan endolyase